MQQTFQDISNLPEVSKIIEMALVEDIGDGDHSSLSCIDQNHQAKAKLIIKDEGVLAGINIAEKILLLHDPNCQIVKLKQDGDFVKHGDIALTAFGNAQCLLKSERLLLNIMQRLSGIATTTYKASSLIKEYRTKVLDTRKTTPNLRILEKWAVTVGGGQNHRIGLYDMIMLKDNHVDVSGGIEQAITKAKKYVNDTKKSLEIEIETRNLEEVKHALNQLPIKRIMLDNFSPEMVKQAVELINNRCETEASGGITLDNIVDYAKAGIDFISLGMLTHSVKSMDISFKIELQK